jgi:23S rRNA (guanosine2251-2'-O)-methyltransferase
MRKLTHEEIAAQRSTIEQLQSKDRFPVVVLLDNVRSLYNVGSIFRTCDGARVAKLLLTGYTPYPPRKEIEKTALHATQSVPWEYIKDPLAAVATMRAQGIRICALEHTDTSIAYSNVKLEDFPICLIIGNEIAGVSKVLLEQADMAIDIPMHGMKHSLNVAVAAGIAIFECVRILNLKR